MTKEVKKLFITEEQYRRLFTEDFEWKDNENGGKDISFIAKRDNNFATPNDTRQYYNDIETRPKNEALVMKPTVIKLNRSKLDCYALFNFKQTELQQAIKNDKWGTKDINVNWANKQEFIDYSLNYAQELITNIVRRLRRQAKDIRLKSGYIVYPSSSSKFNKEFCDQLSTKLRGFKVVDDMFFKSKCDIKVDKEMAQYLGCSANDIASLEYWIAQMEYIDKIRVFREEILSALTEKTKHILNQKDIDTVQYDYSKRKEKSADGNNKYAVNKDYHTYAFTKASENSTRGRYLGHPDYTTLKLSNNISLDIPNGVFHTLEKISKNIDKIVNLYGEYDGALKDIETNKNKLISNGMESGENKDYYNNKQKFAKLDDEAYERVKHKDGKETIERKADSQPNNWSIKTRSEFERRVLTNLFKINEKKNRYFKDTDFKERVIIVFDDNVSGGSTMDNVCSLLEEMQWRWIIPLTLSVMPMGNGGNPFGGTLQGKRDERAGERLYNRINHDERKIKFFAQDFSDGEEIHNYNHKMDNPQYDYEHKSNYQYPERYKKSYIDTRGRRPDKTIKYNNFTIEDVNKISSFKDMVYYLSITNQLPKEPNIKELQNVWRKVEGQRDKF